MLTRPDIETALDELTSNRRGVDFQRIAIPLAQARCPSLIANEVTKDIGEDATYATTSLEGGRVLAAACSTTATLNKIRKDLKRIKESNPTLEALWFYCPKAITRVTSEPWVKKIESEFKVALTVFSREEIVGKLLSPAFSYLAANHLGLRDKVSPGAEKLRQSLCAIAGARADAWLSHNVDTRLHAVNREFLSGTDPEAISKMDLGGLLARLATGGLHVLWGDPGLGKTVAVGQIAKGLLSSGATQIPVIVNGPTWAQSGTPLIDYIKKDFARDGGSSLYDDTSKLMASGGLAVLINGWNEIGEGDLPRLTASVTDFKLSNPGCTLLLVSRRIRMLEALGPHAEYRLAPLSNAARAEISNQLLGDSYAKVVEVLRADREIEILSRVPLFLIPLLDTFAQGVRTPRNAFEVLEASVVSIERVPDHAQGLLGVRDFRRHLSEIGFQLTRRGTTEVAWNVAKTWINNPGDTPENTLALLAQHHVLVGSPTEPVRFQHQYFQDWFCSNRLLESSASGEAVDAQISALIDDRRLTTAWSLVAQRLNVSDEQSAKAITDRLFMLALYVDIDLAASWLPLFQQKLSATCTAELRERIRAMLLGDRFTRLRAFEAIIKARLPGFADEFWPVLESEEQQVRLQIYRQVSSDSRVGDFPVEILGEGWRNRVSTWSEERRIEFASHAEFASGSPYGLLEDFATKDPSQFIRGKCIGRLAFYNRILATQLFQQQGDAVLVGLLAEGSIDELKADVVAKHLDTIEKIARSSDPALPIARAQTFLMNRWPDRILDLIKASVAEAPSGTINSDPRVVFIQRRDPEWVAKEALTRLVRGEALNESLMRSLDSLDDTALRVAADKLSENLKDNIYRLGLLVESGRLSLIKPFFTEMVAMLSGELTNELRNNAFNLRSILAQAPLPILLDLVLPEISETQIEKTMALAHLIDIALDEDRNNIPEADSSDGKKLKVIISKCAAIALADEDKHGGNKAETARLAGRTGYIELKDVVWSLLRAEVTRARTFLAARSQKRLPRGESMAYHAWDMYYISAVNGVSGDQHQVDLLTLFKEDIFTEHAASELSRRYGLPKIGVEAGVGRRVNWRSVAAAQASIGARSVVPEADTAVVAIDAKLAEIRGRSDNEALSFGADHAIAHLEFVRVHLTGIVPTDANIQELLLRQSGYTIAGWFDLYAMCGLVLPHQLVARALKAWGEYSEKSPNHGGDNESVTIRFVCQLLFSDNPAYGITKIRETLGSLKHRYIYRDLALPIATCTATGREELLIELLPHVVELYEWSNAMYALSDDLREKVVAQLLNEGKWTASLQNVQGQIDYLHVSPFIMAICRESQELKKLLEERSVVPLNAFQQHLARMAIQVLGDENTAIRMIHRAAVNADLRSLTNKVVAGVRYTLGPDPRLYNHYAQAIPEIRKVLLQLAYSDDLPLKVWARDLLGDVDRNDMGSIPSTEPRHPDLASGRFWPALDSVTT